jgi:transposase
MTEAKTQAPVPRKKIPDEIVEKIRDMHELNGLGYRKIAKMLDLSRHYVAKICRYERRTNIQY